MKRGIPGVGRGLGRGAWFALLCWAAPLHAAKPGQAFRLEYWADGACPDAAEFARQIQTRAPRLRLAEADEPALGFYAELAEHGGDASGRLTARSADGREVVREVRGPTCADVATALALIAALAADPNQPVDDAPRAAPRSPPPARRRVHDELPTPAVEETETAPGWTFGVGAGVGFESSIAPNPGYGLGVVFEAEGYSESAWRPLFSLSAIRAVASSIETNGNTTSFDWVAFRVSACPARWPEETPLFIRPCGFMDSGFLGGDVQRAGTSQAETKPWFALGAFLRTEALVAEVLSFQLDGGVTVPLVRSQFSAGSICSEFGCEEAPIAFEVPGSGISGRIGVSYRFR